MARRPVLRPSAAACHHLRVTTPAVEAPATPVVPAWSFADRLRKARDYAGLNQAELARALGIHKGLIGKYESGHGRPRDFADFSLRVEEVTGVSAVWLAGLDETARHARSKYATTLESYSQSGLRIARDLRKRHYAVRATALRSRSPTSRQRAVADIRRTAWLQHLSTDHSNDLSDPVANQVTIPTCIERPAVVRDAEHLGS